MKRVPMRIRKSHAIPFFITAIIAGGFLLFSPLVNAAKRRTSTQVDPYAPVWSQQYQNRNQSGPTLQTSPLPAVPPISRRLDPIAGTREQELALRSDLPLEHQKYLLYLYAKTGRDDMAERLARPVLAANPADREALLAMAAMYVEKKKPDHALAYSSALFRQYPDDPEAAYYYGISNQLAGNHAEATRILQMLRMTSFPDKPFPYNVDLAQSALKSGDWQQAIKAYRELLDQDHVSDELRRDVRVVLDQLYRRHLTRIEAEAHAYLLSSGQQWQERIGIRHQLNHRLQVFAMGFRDDLKVNASLNLRPRWADATEVWAGAEYELNRNWTVSSWLGGSDAGLQGGGRFTHRWGDKGDVYVEGFGSERARDGLLIQSLNGRQHRLSVGGSYYLHPRVLTYGELSGRQVTLGGQELGRGLNASWNVEFFLLKDNPRFVVGYRGLATGFARHSDNIGLVADAVTPATTAPARLTVLDQVVLNRIHREGLYADWLGRIFGPVFLHTRAGMDYAFELDSPEFYGRLGFIIYPKRSLELTAETGYTTSAATADQAGGQWEIMIALKYWF